MTATPRRPRSVLRYILQRDRARHASLLALVTVSIGLTLAGVHLLRALIDRAIPARSRSLALTLGGAMLAAAAARVVVDYAKAMVSERVRQDVIARLRGELLAHLLRMPPDFFAANSVGQLMNKVQTDTGRLGMSVGWIFVEPLVETVTVIVYAAYLIASDWRLFLVAAAPVPLVVALSPRINRRLSKMSTEFTGRMGAYAARLQETFANASEVQSHDTFAFEEARADRSQRDLVDTWMDVTRSVSSLAALSDVARGVGPAVVFTVGALLAIRGELPVGELVAFAGLLGGLYASLDKLVKYPSQLKVAQDRYDEFGALFDRAPHFVDPASPAAAPATRGAAVKVDGLSFEHAQGRRVVDALDLAVREGEHVAIVGRSGCGKSTVLGLLAGRLAPRSGAIVVAGVPVGSLALTERARLVGHVSQAAVLFRTTLRFNLEYATLRGRGDVTLAGEPGVASPTDDARDAPLLEACKDVGLGDDLVEMGLGVRVSAARAPEFEAVRELLGDDARRGPWDEALPLRDNLLARRAGDDAVDEAARRRRVHEALEAAGMVPLVERLALDFDVGEGGSRLSGGQKQKVALARVLLKSPSLLLLDEVTASLDEASARRVIALLRERHRGRTVLAVTHDLASTASFDRVVVMDQGRVVQEGTYETLSRAPGLFAQLRAASEGRDTDTRSHDAQPAR